MKKLLAVALLSFSIALPAAAMPASGSLQGVVLEVQMVENFSYLRLQSGGKEVWAAVVNASVNKGDTVTIDDAVVMKDFTSKALDRTFPSIVFGTLHGEAGNADTEPVGADMRPATGSALGNAFSSMPPRKLESIKQDEVIAKAKGVNAYTVGEVFTQASSLKGKTVQVRGRVVKYNPEIMGKNWVHLRDGSGSAADESNDLLVATTGKTQVGAVVTARGVVVTDKDLGMGYRYKALLEDAALQ